MTILKIGVLLPFAMCAAACLGSPAAPTEEGPSNAARQAYVAELEEGGGDGCSNFTGYGYGSTEGSAMDAAYGDALNQCGLCSCTLEAPAPSDTEAPSDCPDCAVFVGSFSCCG
jgi:hypothetical protein